jgi:hypothetical protein
MALTRKRFSIAFTLANGETSTDWPGHLVLKLLAEDAQHPQP